MHIHDVYDSDKHFKINHITRALENQVPEKSYVMQYDHNSERITFELPSFIEGHNMMDCNRVEVHYINSDSKAQASNPGLYTVDDLQVAPDDSGTVLCSWLISGNATQLVGPLFFRVTFKCVTNGSVDYSWSTAIYKGLSVQDGINNAEYIVETYADVLEQWRSSFEQLTSEQYIRDAVSEYFSNNGVSTSLYVEHTTEQDDDGFGVRVPFECGKCRRLLVSIAMPTTPANSVTCIVTHNGKNHAAFALGTASVYWLDMCFFPGRTATCCAIEVGANTSPSTRTYLYESLAYSYNGADNMCFFHIPAGTTITIFGVPV